MTLAATDSAGAYPARTLNLLSALKEGYKGYEGIVDSHGAPRAGTGAGVVIVRCKLAE